MKHPQHDTQYSQNSFGIFGTAVVFLTVVTAPQWLQSVESTAPSSPQPDRIESRLVEPSSEASLALDEGPQAGDGAKHYQQFCAACHGGPGSERVPGLAGSDLFDGVSEQPFTPELIRVTLQEGIIEKGMIPMKAVLSEPQLQALVEYVLANQPS